MTGALQTIRLEYFNIHSVFACLRYLVRALDDADRAEIDAAFAGNEDPLFGPAHKAEFDAPFREIVNDAPAPMGFGDRKAEAG
ncbi:MAG: hypothetical protein V3R74_04975 [Alphaproteobacteria bacterium]